MYKNILVPIDFAHKEVVGQMIAAAKALADKGAGMTLLYVIPEIPTVVAADLPAGSAEKAQANLEAQLRQLAADSGAPENTKVLAGHGRPHHTILEMAAKNDVDLIVVASHQPEFSDYLLGSVAAGVVRHAPCSVHVIR